MRRLIIIPLLSLLLLPLGAHASDSTGYARSSLSCQIREPTGCHPDHETSISYVLGNTFPEMGWVHVELTMPDAPEYGLGTMTLVNPDGTASETWTHEGRSLDTFMVWAPVHTGQKLVFSGTCESVSRSVFHPCIKQN